jgi:hypothetical protein
MEAFCFTALRLPTPCCEAYVGGQDWAVESEQAGKMWIQCVEKECLSVEALGQLDTTQHGRFSSRQLVHHK